MDKLTKKSNNLRSIKIANRILIVGDILLGWQKRKQNKELETVIECFNYLATEFSAMELEIDRLHLCNSELRADKNHFALRTRESEKQLKKYIND